jgi:uncharacterized protein YjbJ (UPF0337 family)
MNKDRVKGTIDEMVGSAKQKAGNLTGNIQLQVEGMTQQVKGKVENAWGKGKDAARDAKEEAGTQRATPVSIKPKKSA